MAGEGQINTKLERHIGYINEIKEVAWDVRGRPEHLMAQSKPWPSRSRRMGVGLRNERIDSGKKRIGDMGKGADNKRK